MKEYRKRRVTALDVLNKRQPNVLFLAEEVRTGGAESYYYALEAGIDRSKINFFSVAVSKKDSAILKYPQFFQEGSFSLLKRVCQIKRIARKSNIDVVHANSLSLAIASIIARRIFNLNYAIAYTKHNLTRLEKLSPTLFAILVNKEVDYLIAICETDRNELISAGVNKDLIVVINNSVNTEDYIFQPHYLFNSVKRGELKIGILARLSPEKRHILFLKICKLIKDDFSALSVEVAGDGPQREEIGNFINENGMAGYVQMLGNVDAKKFLARIDYLFLVSEREVFPMSVLEGMASGVLVFSNDIGGVKDVVDSDTGYLVKGDEPEIYYAAVKESLECDQMGKLVKARAKICESFSLKNSLKEHEKLYFTATEVQHNA